MKFCLILFVVGLFFWGCKKGATSIAEEQAVKYGLNYYELSKKAESDEKYFRLFCLLGVGEIFDGAGAEDYSFDTNKLFLYYGDRKFVEIIDNFPVEIQKSVVDTLSCENGKETDAEVFNKFLGKNNYFKRLYHRFYK